MAKKKKRKRKAKSKKLIREAESVVKNSVEDETAIKYLSELVGDDFPGLENLGSMDLHEALDVLEEKSISDNSSFKSKDINELKESTFKNEFSNDKESQEIPDTFTNEKHQKEVLKRIKSIKKRRNKK